MKSDKREEAGSLSPVPKLSMGDRDSHARNLIIASAKMRRLRKMFSHDLKSPVGIIKTGSALALSGKLGEISAEPARLLKMIASNADKTLAMIEEILSITSLEQSLVPLTFEELCPKSFLEQQLSSKLGEYDKKGIVLEFSYPDNYAGMHLSVDRGRFFELIDTFLDMVFERSHPGTSVKVDISTLMGRRKTDTGEILRVDFRHTTNGSDDEVIKAFFEFGRTGAPGAAILESQLTYCREICQLHAGNIVAKYEAPNEILWSIYLPRVIRTEVGQKATSPNGRPRT